MTPIRALYLILAILGAIVPMFYFVQWFLAYGWSLADMITAWNVNDASTGLVWDLTISALALTAFILYESVKRQDYWPVVSILATFCIGVSCGLPLYLFLRSRPQAKVREQDGSFSL